MTQAAITQLLFDILTAVLLFAWYFPLRWLLSAEVHPLKVNILLQATYSFERSMKALLAVVGTAFPLLFFFFLQQYLLPKFIVAGHIGIWIASAPMLVIALYFQYHLLHSLTKRMEQAARIDNNLVLQDLQARCADTALVIGQNDSLRKSQIRLAAEADKAISALKQENGSLMQTNTLLQQQIHDLKLRLEIAESKAASRLGKQDSPVSINRFPRQDGQYYVRIGEMIEAGLLLYDDQPVTKAHAKRYLTKQHDWIVQAKSGGALYAKVADLVRNGYEIGANPIAKTLLYGCEPDSGDFYPLSAEPHRNKGLSHFRTFAAERKPHFTSNKDSASIG